MSSAAPYPGTLRHPGMLLAVLAGTLLLLAGCSDGRPGVPNFQSVAPPTGFIHARYPAAGVALRLPRDWTLSAGRAPMVAVASSGPAIISLWRYPSRHAAITGTAQLHLALAALVRAARRRDAGMVVDRTGITSVDGAGAVIIEAKERIGQLQRRIRSEHVYLDGAELVLETYAPPTLFARIDPTVFSPVRASLRLIGGGHPGARSAPAAGTRTALTAGPPGPAPGSQAVGR